MSTGDKNSVSKKPVHGAGIDAKAPSMSDSSTYESAQFARDDVEVRANHVVFDGFFKMACMELRHRLFKGGWSDWLKREILVKTEAAAAVIYDPARDLIGLIDQFRIGALDSEYGPWSLEVVAGMLEPGESPETLILRELYEEAGISDAELIHITSYYSTPGGCNEKIHLYCALCNLSQAGGVFGLDDEGEDILLTVHSADAVLNAMMKSRMNNAATLIGLQWLQQNRHELRSASGNDLAGS